MMLIVMLIFVNIGYASDEITIVENVLTNPKEKTNTFDQTVKLAKDLETKAKHVMELGKKITMKQDEFDKMYDVAIMYGLNIFEERRDEFEAKRSALIERVRHLEHIKVYANHVYDPKNKYRNEEMKSMHANIRQNQSNTYVYMIQAEQMKAKSKMAKQLVAMKLYNELIATWKHLLDNDEMEPDLTNQKNVFNQAEEKYEELLETTLNKLERDSQKLSDTLQRQNLHPDPHKSQNQMLQDIQNQLLE